jgi:hemoglobin
MDPGRAVEAGADVDASRIEDDACLGRIEVGEGEREHRRAQAANIYEALGAETLHGIARTFYGMVDVDPEPRFRSMFPPKLDEAIQNLAEFLIQYFGGPTDYDKRRGHPRLRGRHLEFHIDKWARDRWMSYMTKAVESANIPENYRKFILGYFDHTATFLMNQGGPPPGHDGNTP